VKHNTLYKCIAFLGLILLALLPAACTVGVSAQPAATSTPLPTPIIAVKPTYKVQTGEVSSSVIFSGRIEPKIQEHLFFHTNGRIRNLNVKEGVMVKQGDVLADLETLDALERQQGLGQLAIQRAQVEKAMAELELKQAKAEAYSYSDRTYNVPMREYAVKLADIALQEAQINNTDLSYVIDAARIISPIDGFVLSEAAVSSGSEVAAYQEILVIADKSVLEVSATPDSTTVSKIQTGMPVTVTLVNRPGVAINGEIRSLPYFSVSGAGQDKSTRISLDSLPQDLGLGIGDIVQVNVVLQKKDNVLWLPPQAVRTFEGRRFVVVQDEQGQRRVDVKVGLQNNDRVEIVEGLSEGQVVVSP
jgi:membrane fusion protein, macrolide-specific efflux system